MNKSINDFFKSNSKKKSNENEINLVNESEIISKKVKCFFILKIKKDSENTAR